MNFAVRSILGILAVSMWAHSAMANNNATATSALTVQQPKKAGGIWSGFLNASRSSSLVDFQDGSRQDGADYLARVTAKINSDYSLRLSGGYSQDLNYSENNDVADATLSFVRTPVKFGRTFLLGYRTTGLVPLSRNAKAQSLQTAISAVAVGVINPDRLIPGFEISGSISAGRNIHQFETAVGGKVNTQYTSNQALSLAYSFKYGISLSAELVHKNTWSYQNVMRDGFEASQELGFELNPNLSVAVGHTNSGSTLRPNGSDSNIELINENTSIVYGSLSATF